MLTYVLWQIVSPLMCGALAGRFIGAKFAFLIGLSCGTANLIVNHQPVTALISAVLGGTSAWLTARTNAIADDAYLRKQHRRLTGGLRWAGGILIGNIVGLLMLGGSLPAIARPLTQFPDHLPAFTPGWGTALPMLLLGPLVSGAVGAWITGRPYGRRAATAGALCGLYALQGATSLLGAIIAVWIMVCSAAGGLIARRAPPQERSRAYLVVGAVAGGSLMTLLLASAFAVISPVLSAAFSMAEPPLALVLIAAAPLSGGIVSAAFSRRAYVRAALHSCLLPVLASVPLMILTGVFHVLSVLIVAVVAAIGASIGGLLVQLVVALYRRAVPTHSAHPPSAPHGHRQTARTRPFWIGVRLALTGALVAVIVLYGNLLPLPARPVAAQVVTPEQAEAFWAAYRPTLAQAATLTPADLVQMYDRSYRDRIDFDPTQAAFYDLVARSLAFKPAQVDILRTNGYVVAESLTYDSFGHAYQDIYRRDLPVFITTDSILHALHRSYDDMLADVERQIVIPELASLLDSLQGYVGQRHLSGADPRLRPVLGDLQRYLRVARALLADAPPLGDAQAAAWFRLAREGRGVGEVTFFEETRVVDWTRFQPAGRYAKSAQMGAYFRAMRWLGTMDWRLTTFNLEKMETTFHPEQAAAALLLLDAVEGTRTMGRWQELDALMTLFAGAPDGMELPALQALRADAALGTPSAVYDPDVRARLVERLQTHLYGVQQINAVVMFSDFRTPEPTPLPASFALFQPRYTVDAHVFSNVVFDRVVYDGKKVWRAFPSPLDALFVLGNDYAPTLLDKELAQYQHQGNLMALRTLVDGYDPSAWEESLVGLWLGALRTLNEDTTDAPYPQVMQTAAWAAKSTQTQLFSWAQLRHDAVLYVKQTTTMYALCDYPAGYVEPYPEFYATVAAWARRARTGLQERRWNPRDRALRDRILAYLDRLETTIKQLETLARKELEEQPFTSKEEEFLRQVIVIQRYYTCWPQEGVPTTYDGWYPQLFYAGPERSDEADPTVAPIHTNLDPKLGPVAVLYAATGQVRPMVVAVDSGDDRAVYVGPVGSYYEFIEPLGTVWTDEMWEQRLRQDPPSPPGWWRPYVQ
jgi:hypothetical protein